MRLCATNIGRAFLSTRLASFAFLLLSGTFGCNSPVHPETPIEANNPGISYYRFDPWSGTQKIRIESDGLVSYDTYYPTLQLKLTGDELRSLLDLLTGFENYRDSYPGTCLDDSHFILTLKSQLKTKTVEIDGCSFLNFPEISPLGKFFGRMEELAQRVYNEKAPWIGLEYRFSLNDTTYSSGDTIRVSCFVTNPTQSEKHLFFRHSYRLQFGMNNSSEQPPLQQWIPDFSVLRGDTLSPSKLTLLPGEEAEVFFLWDQSFVNYDGSPYTQLPQGNYDLWVFLLAAIQPTGHLTFTIT